MWVKNSSTLRLVLWLQNYNLCLWNLINTFHICIIINFSNVVNLSGDERPTSWTQWSAWSSCSKPCGTGPQARRRACNKTGIEDCIGDESETRQCNVNSCEGNFDWRAKMTRRGDLLYQKFLPCFFNLAIFRNKIKIVS